MALASVGCGDLALVPVRIPSSLTLSPADTLLTQGDQVQFRVTVLDQHGEPMDGLPPWARPAWSSSDLDAVYVSGDGDADALKVGEAKITVALAGLTTQTRIRINPDSVILSVPAFYITQGAQNRGGGVPLIAGRQALLRVFVVGDRVSFFQPRVHAVFFSGDKLVHNVLMSPGFDRLPVDLDEARLDQSYNAMIPAYLLQPDVRMYLELDRDAVIPLADGSRRRIPATGELALDVQVLPPLDLTVVPVLVASAPDERVFDWTGELKPEGEHLRLARSVFPISDLGVEVHEPYVTSADLTTGAGWGQLLGELTFLHMSEGSRGYYYGAVELPEGSPWKGLGYIGGFRVSVGAPDGETLAHELGHNLSLRHAPCGGAVGPDADYPYSGGDIGVWGYDFHGGRLVHPALYKDVMGYCNPSWISDYHFARAMDYRLTTEAVPTPESPQDSAPVGKRLLLWGSANDDELLLEPAFLVDAPVTLPDEDGPYRLEGFGSGGERSFSLTFAPQQVEYGRGRFLFALPFDSGRARALDRVVLSGPGRSFTLDRSGAHPVAMVIDRGTGRLRAILRDWAGTPAFAPDGSTEILVSRGLP